MPTIKVNSIRYKALQRNPLLFIHKRAREIWRKTEENRYGFKDYEYYWGTFDEETDCNLEVNAFGDKYKNNDCILVIAKIPTDNPADSNNQNFAAVEIRNIFIDKPEDWKVILNDCISKIHEKDGRYNFMALLWCTHHYEIKENILEEAIRYYDTRVQSYFINTLKEIGVCLSITKQETLLRVLTKFNISYNIYCPPVVNEAMKSNMPEFDYIKSNYSLFNVIDFIFGDYSEFTPFNEQQTVPKTAVQNPLQFDSTTGMPIKPQQGVSKTKDNTNINNSTNILLTIQAWLHDETICLKDYEELKRWFALFSETTKMKIVRRYFHDIRLGNTTYNSTLLDSFKNNQYERLSRFRYCIEMPEKPIPLTVPLLCDSIMTFVQSKGQELQSFNGIIDIAIMYCDKTKPNVDFELKEILPICDGGAVHNEEYFNGFIDFEVIYKLMEDKMTTENLENTIKSLLDEYTKKCLKQEPYNDKWNVRSDDRNTITITTVH